ncbi:hypothetical protein [Mangrovimonas sp. DI 80]|uniref:hypothetical protein n=1 Tax=Mangrovimonas sp. DI 80 TaxID=1779330 RepID=UPI000976F71E|nr:hypothetical protein [Mangrovimonas sp. DI 80]OMP32650.1 hypothetical protein BKM32_06305 [Mangrovimonas sp. DI 80]
MKKVIALIVLGFLPIMLIGQNNTTENLQQDTKIIKETSVEKTESTKEIKEGTELKSAIKAQVLDLNYRKSNDIISVKAYKKSLQIKAKSIKLC